MERSIFERNVCEHIKLLAEIHGLQERVAHAGELMSEALALGHTVFCCGNGGSAADAQHMAAELSGRYLKERNPLNSVALHTNTSAMTAIANDYGFDEVYARQLQAHAKRGDVLVAISTSGNSANIVRAVETARGMGVLVVGMTGGAGGKIGPLCDVLLPVPSDSTPRIQEMHILLIHIMCEIVESQTA